MSLILAKCIEYHDERKICTASENGKTYRLYNVSNHKIKKVRVDKCISQSEGEERCDYLMDIAGDDLQRVIFIELKGGGLVKAVRQLYSTIIYLKNNFKGYQLDARIVGSRDVPDFISTPDYRKLAKEIKSTNGTIERATNKTYNENV
jgi:hypothetical protein